MALTTAERNKRKRERKKRERAEAQRLQQQQLEEAAKSQKDEDDVDVQVEIEYVAEPPPENNNNHNQGDDGDEQDLQAVMRRFQDRAALVYVTDGEEGNNNNDTSGMGTSDSAKEKDNDNLDDENATTLSKTKLKAMFRPTVAELKQRSLNPELVEAHDITAPDPDFLIYLKGIPGTVPVPRHWGRKRKYLQGKRGVEKPPFALPDFIVKTGICDVRAATAEDDAKMSVKQKNRMRVSGKGGGVDVDYRTLYEAFFQHQTKPENLTDFGDLYYEGKEYETARSSNFRPGFMSERLREALGMANEYSPPPWLINMQRYGPPPSYPNARIPGLNAPLPTGASYGYHVGGWGKPPVDAFGRPLYGGDPFGQPDVPNKDGDDEMEDMYGLSGGLVPGAVITSDGKAIGKKSWGALPNAFGDGRRDNDEGEEEEESSSEEEESSEEEMEESEEENGHLVVPDGTTDAESRAAGMDSVLPDGVDSVVPSSAIDLRKPGDETPMLNAGPKQLYTVLQQTAVDKGDSNAVFASDHAYVLPGAGPGSGVPEGAASVLSKAGPAGDGKKRTRPKDDEDEADELGKKFKF
jgi:splicing factor 3B subunit 2